MRSRAATAIVGAAIFAAIGDVGQNDGSTNVFVRIDVGIFICADKFDIDNWL
jgi:hypothetical protein